MVQVSETGFQVINSTAHFRSAAHNPKKEVFLKRQEMHRRLTRNVRETFRINCPVGIAESWKLRFLSIVSQENGYRHNK